MTLFAIASIFMLPLLAACIVAWCQEALRLFHFVICFWQRVCELYAESGFVGIAAVLGALGIILAFIGLIEATQNTEI